MAIYKTQAIILKRYNVNEADRILTVLTEKRGKIRAIARGVRKPLSKLGSHIEPFYLVHLMMAEGKSLDTVSDVEVREYFPKLREELTTMGRACRFGELIDCLTDEEEAQRPLFFLLANCLKFLDKQPDNPALDIFFQLNAMAQLGYRPELHQCVKCQGKIIPEEIAWDCGQGGVVCVSCPTGAEGRRVSADAVKILRLFLKNEISVLNRLEVTPELLSELQGIMTEYVTYLNQRELVSDRFLRSIGKACDVKLG